MGAVFFVLSPLIALLAFTPIPLIIWGAFYFQRKAGPLYADVREKVGDPSRPVGQQPGRHCHHQEFHSRKTGKRSG